MCPQSIITGRPLPFVAITLPTLSILVFSKPSSFIDLSFKRLASDASALDGVYSFSDLFNNSIAYAGETNFVLDMIIGAFYFPC